MAVSTSHLGYNKLSQAIFEWQAADRTSLLASFMVMEVSLHWLWCLFVWWRRDVYDTYVDIGLLYPLWFGMTLVALFLLWMTTRFSPVKKNNSDLYKWQGILITVYSVYIAIVILVLGHSSLVAGVSLVGGAMLGMMLIRRRYVWRAFLGHVAIILAVTFIPYLGVTLPNLRQMTLTVFPVDTYSYINSSEMTMVENAISASIFQNGTLHWESVNQLRRSSAFFWRSTHIYMSLPKAIFIIYMFRILLLILDESKKEILHHANQDELTQLKSRRYGLTQMKQVLKSVKDHQDISIILLDLDWFKEVNDNYGHEVGDRVLIEVAQMLLQSLTDETIISRYGGEEFLIVLPDTSHDTAMIIAEQLRRVIAKHVIIVDEDTIFSVTASLGLYTLTHDERKCIKKACEMSHKKEAAQSLAQLQSIRSYSSKYWSHQTPTAQLPHDICQRLIRMADKALYEAKGCGRDQVVSANEMLAENNNITALYGT